KITLGHFVTRRTFFRTGLFGQGRRSSRRPGGGRHGGRRHHGYSRLFGSEQQKHARGGHGRESLRGRRRKPQLPVLQQLLVPDKNRQYRRCEGGSSYTGPL